MTNNAFQRRSKFGFYESSRAHAFPSRACQCHLNQGANRGRASAILISRFCMALPKPGIYHRWMCAFGRPAKLFIEQNSTGAFPLSGFCNALIILHSMSVVTHFNLWGYGLAFLRGLKISCSSCAFSARVFDSYSPVVSNRDCRCWWWL